MICICALFAWKKDSFQFSPLLRVLEEMNDRGSRKTLVCKASVKIGIEKINHHIFKDK